MLKFKVKLLKNYKIYIATIPEKLSKKELSLLHCDELKFAKSYKSNSRKLEFLASSIFHLITACKGPVLKS